MELPSFLGKEIEVSIPEEKIVPEVSIPEKTAVEEPAVIAQEEEKNDHPTRPEKKLKK